MKKRFSLIALLVCMVFIIASCTSVYNMETGMNTLTSDEMAGRQAGSPGGAAAAKYIQDEFTALGIEQHLQPFHFLTYSPDGFSAALRLTQQGQVSECALGVDFTPTRISAANNVKGAITFDRNDADLDKKILVTDKLFSLKDIAKKPKGILFVEKSLVKRVEVRETPMPVFSISKALYDQLAGGSATEVEMSISAKFEPLIYQNVIGVIPGKNRKEAVVISAHYDGCGFDDCGIYKGAVDNASGVVTMLKCAEILADYYRGSAPSVDIVFAAFDGEESGLIGSQYFMQQSVYKKLSNINIDCVGKGNLYVQSDSENTDLAKAVSEHITGSQTGALGGFSDNMVFSFYKCGAVLITTMQKSDMGEIHTVKDTADDVDRMLLLKLANDIADYMTDRCGKSEKDEKAAPSKKTEEPAPSATEAPPASDGAAESEEAA